VIFYINLLLKCIIIIDQLHTVDWKGRVARMIHVRNKECKQKIARRDLNEEITVRTCVDRRKWSEFIWRMTVSSDLNF